MLESSHECECADMNECVCVGMKAPEIVCLCVQCSCVEVSDHERVCVSVRPQKVSER